MTKFAKNNIAQFLSSVIYTVVLAVCSLNKSVKCFSETKQSSAVVETSHHEDPSSLQPLWPTRHLAEKDTRLILVLVVKQFTHIHCKTFKSWLTSALFPTDDMAVTLQFAL